MVVRICLGHFPSSAAHLQQVSVRYLWVPPRLFFQPGSRNGTLSLSLSLSLFLLPQQKSPTFGQNTPRTLRKASSDEPRAKEPGRTGDICTRSGTRYTVHGTRYGTWYARGGSAIIHAGKNRDHRITQVNLHDTKEILALGEGVGLFVPLSSPLSPVPSPLSPFYTATKALSKPGLRVGSFLGVRDVLCALGVNLNLNHMLCLGGWMVDREKKKKKKNHGRASGRAEGAKVGRHVPWTDVIVVDVDDGQVEVTYLNIHTSLVTIARATSKNETTLSFFFFFGITLSTS
ncbi:hypothetical protein GGR50DRAFT_412708 [Xylaria sp. CBS 124048]|nr:hypothetical protein GGR50DRAFT_412708 [Xylaria sp. CBS 124048]